MAGKADHSHHYSVILIAGYLALGVVLGAAITVVIIAVRG